AAACKGRNAQVQYAMKANSNLAVLQVFARLGAGFDIVSGGELKRVLAAGGDPRKVVFSGVGKNAAEMELALAHDVRCFNVESIPELDRLNEVAGRAGKRARVSLRINPDVDAKTHPYISTGLKGNKFGIAFEDVLPAYRAAPRPAGGAVRAGPLTGRQCRRAADAGGVPEARRGQELLHRRCRHERPGAPGDVRGLPPHRAGGAARRAGGDLRYRRSGVRI